MLRRYSICLFLLTAACSDPKAASGQNFKQALEQADLTVHCARFGHAFAGRNPPSGFPFPLQNSFEPLPAFEAMVAEDMASKTISRGLISVYSYRVENAEQYGFANRQEEKPISGKVYTAPYICPGNFVIDEIVGFPETADFMGQRVTSATYTWKTADVHPKLKQLIEAGVFYPQGEAKHQFRDGPPTLEGQATATLVLTNEG